MQECQLENFTEREKQVLELLIKGLSNSEISKMLEISVHTTKAFLTSIYCKLGVVNRVQAALKYFEFKKENL